jgi:hypothetical protein
MSREPGMEELYELTVSAGGRAMVMLCVTASTEEA